MNSISVRGSKDYRLNGIELRFDSRKSARRNVSSKQMSNKRNEHLNIKYFSLDFVRPDQKLIVHIYVARCCLSCCYDCCGKKELFLDYMCMSRSMKNVRVGIIKIVETVFVQRQKKAIFDLL